MNLNKIKRWYGSPGLRAASESGTDIALIGASEENLLMTATLLARGSSIALINGAIDHRFLPHPSNSEVSHEDFYAAIGIELPDITEAQLWNDRGDKLFVLGWKLESLECWTDWGTLHGSSG